MMRRTRTTNLAKLPVEGFAAKMRASRRPPSWLPASRLSYTGPGLCSGIAGRLKDLMSPSSKSRKARCPPSQEVTNRLIEHTDEQP